MALTHLSLFSGIGGIDLAAEWAGFETVGQVEWADYPTKVLEKHWPDVPRWRDIRDVTGEVLPNGITVVSGGFPCQPFSVAGKQEGKEDNRYLWPEMRRVIREVRPTWVVGENVKGILSIAADTVCEELESEGYFVQPFCFPALSVGARHRRDRVFFVGYAKHNGLSSATLNRITYTTGHNDKKREIETRESERTGGRGSNEDMENARRALRQGSEFGRTHEDEVAAGLANLVERSGGARTIDMADSDSKRLQGSEETGDAGSERSYTEQYITGCSSGADQWAVEPDVGRVANGIPSRVDRLKCLGNAVVPQQIYPIFKAIADIENGVLLNATHHRK